MIPPFTYFLSTLLLICFVIATTSMQAQIFQDWKFTVRDSFPYTYVPKELVPDSILADSAWRETLHRENYSDGPPVRNMFHIYHHPELVLFDDQDRMKALVPREPGEVEVLTYITARRKEGKFGLNFNGYRSSTPGAEFASLGYLEFDNGRDSFSTRADTVYYGYTEGGPSSYRLNEGPPGHTRWGYFVQFVDERFHPAYSGTDDKYRVSAPAAFPSPADSQITIGTPEAWLGLAGAIVVYGVNGQAVVQQTIDSFNESGTSVALHELPGGRYFAQLRLRDSPGWTTVSFVKR